MITGWIILDFFAQIATAKHLLTQEKEKEKDAKSVFNLYRIKVNYV